jgi:DNA invertase Pin-like site-specific DNA recombinase
MKRNLRESTPVRCARYIRVSRIDQRPDLQHHETAVFAERRGWEVTCTYEDCGFSGAKAGRPGLASMLADARKGKFDLVLVYRTDRLFRSLRDMVITLDDLSAIDVGFASVTEPFDTSTPSGRLLFGMVATFAEFERDVLRERTRAGVAAARARGKRLGRPTVRVDLARARLLRSTGLSYAEIANDLGVATTTLRRALAA